MSISTNIVVLAGHLATDVRLRETQSGKQVASFKLAINRPGEDNGADFVWVKTWNGSASACAKYIGKGKAVQVEGEIRTSRVGEGDSFKEYFEVNARRVTFLSPRQNDGSSVEPTTVEVSTEPPTDGNGIPF